MSDLRTPEDRAARLRQDDRVDETIRRITPKLPMRGCRAVIKGRDVRLTSDGLFSGNMHLCRDAYCKFCARNIARRRRLETIKMIGEAFAFGQFVHFLTLTPRHKQSDWLPDLLRQNQDALNHTFDVSQRSYRQLKAKYGLLGLKWSAERTWSKRNGWHPHFHILLFVNRQWTPSEGLDFRADIGARWIDGQRRAGGRKPTLQRGVQMEQVTNDLDDILRVGGYMSKVGEGIAEELAGEGNKRGRADDSWTFWQKADALAESEFGLPKEERAALYLPMPDKTYGIATLLWQERDRSIWREGPREGAHALLPDESAKMHAEISHEMFRVAALRRRVPDDDDIEDWDSYRRLIRRIKYFEDDIEWMRAEYQRCLAESEWRLDHNSNELFRVGELVRHRVFLPDREHLRELVEWMIHSGERTWGGSRAHPNPANADEERWNRILAAANLNAETRESLEAFESRLAYHLGFEDEPKADIAEDDSGHAGTIGSADQKADNRRCYYIDGASYMSLVFSDAEFRSDLRIAAIEGEKAFLDLRAQSGLVADTSLERFELIDRGLGAHVTREMLSAEPYLEPWMLSIPDRRGRPAKQILRDFSNHHRDHRRDGRDDSTSYQGRASRASSGPPLAIARRGPSGSENRAAARRHREQITWFRKAYEAAGFRRVTV